MSSFTYSNIGSINLMTEAEAESFIHRAFLSEEDGAPVEHGMLIDSTQFLTLGGISYMQVAATAVNQAANASMEIGSIFDVATAQSVAYGKHLDKVMKNLNEESLITENLVFSGAYLKSREQLQINSELMTDKNGRQYYEVLRRFQFVYSNTNSPWYSHESKNEVKRRFRLYTKGGKFYTLKRGNINPVKLGDPSVFDGAISYIRANGFVEGYLKTINSEEVSSKAVEVADNQQLVFLTVMQVLKPQLEAAYTASIEA